MEKKMKKIFDIVEGFAQYVGYFSFDDDADYS
jgi:hypothetical protein